MAENSDQNPVAMDAQPLETLRRGVKKALIVGISQYVTGWRSLPAAKRDAEVLQQLLTSPNIGNFDEVKLLINPDRQQVEDEVYALAVSSQPHDLILVYFSGWGAREENGRLYLTTSITRKDAFGELSKPTAVLLSALQEPLNHSPANQQVVILDCCFDVNSIAPHASETDELDFKNQIGGANRAVLVASAATTYLSEQKQADHSLYTRYLIEGIVTGAANRSIANQITLQDLHDYTRRRVQAAAPAIEPVLYLPRPEFDLVLAQAPARTAQMIYRQQVEAHSRSGETAISDFDRLILNWRRDRLGLSPDTTAEVEKAVLQPYEDHQEKLRQYRQKLTSVVGYQYPLRETTLAHLERLRQRFGLVKDQTEAIAAETIAPYKQQHQQNLQRFEQHFVYELEQGGYPPDRGVRNELRYLEQQLHLKPADVAEVQRRVIAEYQERYQQRLEQYRQNLRQAIAYHYPLDDRTRYDLRQQQRFNQLKDEDVAAIAAEVRAELHLSLTDGLEQWQDHSGQSVEDIPANVSSEPDAIAGISSDLEAAIADQPEPSPEEYQHNIDQYRQYFIGKFQPSQPLDDGVLEELRSLQSVLRLRAADVAQAEAEGAEEKLDDYDQKLRQYEQEFYRTAETDLSDPANRDRLTRLQHELSLTDSDVALVEKIALELLDCSPETRITSIDLDSDDRSALLLVEPASDSLSLQHPVDEHLVDAISGDRLAERDPIMTIDRSDSQADSIVTESEITDTPLQPEPAVEDTVSVNPSSAVIPEAASVKASQTVLPLESPLTRSARIHPTAVASTPIDTTTNKSIIEQLQAPQSRLTAVLQIIRAVGLAVLAIALGRVLITQLLRFLPGLVGQSLALILFALAILLSWKALNLLK
jgi:hypothetical protein